MINDKAKDYGDRGAGWDHCPKRGGTLGGPPARSSPRRLRMLREKRFAPQWVLHHRVKAGGRKEADPLHSTPPLLDDNSDHIADKISDTAGAAAREAADEMGMGQESPCAAH